MKPIVDLEECLRDSPKFRASLEESEEDIDQLETKLEKLVKLCSSMVESGNLYLQSKRLFITGVTDLSRYFKDDVAVVSALNKLGQALSEMLKYQSILVDQAHRSICKNLNEFVKKDIRQVKDTKRYFEKISDDLDQSLIRNSQAPRSKPHECEETKNILTAMRSCFQHTALDYVCQISLLHSKKRYEVLDSLVSFMHAHSTFVHQGSDLCMDVDPFIKSLANNLAGMREETNELQKDLDGRHNMVTSKEPIPNTEYRKSSAEGIRLEGYIFKRTSNAFKTWNRRWFIIQNNQLVYRKRGKDAGLTIMEEDLRLCHVKMIFDTERRFCFEVLSPTKSHILQADSEEMCNAWVTALQAGINAAIQYTSHDEMNPNDSSKSNASASPLDADDNKSVSENLKASTSPSVPAWQVIVGMHGNDQCCDCKSPKPRWASINLGITLCIECSGIHRSLGVHHSKVRSLTLDAWEQDLVKIMTELGNDYINKLYEANVDESVAVHAAPDSIRSVREAWIKAKYIQKAFVHRTPNLTDRKPCLVRRWNARKLSHRRRLTAAASQVENLTEASIRQEKCPSAAQDKTRRSGMFFDAEKNLPSMENNDPQSLIIKSELTNLASPQDADVTETKIDENEKEDQKEMETALPSNELNPASTELNADTEQDKASESQDDEDYDSALEEVEESLNPNLMLHKAAVDNSITQMCEALALGADLNWVNEEDASKCSIHHAVISGSVTACEYLFLNGAKTNAKDGLGRTPLHLATELGNTGQVCLLLKRGADQHALDNTGHDALSVAVKNANADIVTLLRLAKLNDEMKDCEFGTHDDTFNEVVRDFSKLASDNPEKFKRIVSVVNDT